MSGVALPVHTGRHFLQIPGPTNVPDEVLRAIDRPTIDHRGPEFAALTQRILPALAPVFGTDGPVVIYPASGTGAWEAALVNTLSPGDAVVCCETGHFSTLWTSLAERLGLRVEVIPGDWRHGADPEAVGRLLADDVRGRIKAVMVVHNETSTGVTSRVSEIRSAMDAAGHDALLLVDTISSLGSMPFCHDKWRVDVTVAGSQKGLMLPPGLSFNAISPKALAASQSAALPRAYWDWAPILQANADGFFPSTPATNLLYGLEAALGLLHREVLPNVFARHSRHAAATRASVAGWGLEVLAADSREFSASLTAILLPAGHDADAVRRVILDRFDMSLGTGLGRLTGQVFRIGHLGHFNDLMLAGTLAGVQMGLRLAGVPVDPNGLHAGLAVLETDPWRGDGN
jgi:alanine-glyoxylate transaminase/serine-glyoxylate transaminase/serine-pyruvate transaminase